MRWITKAHKVTGTSDGMNCPYAVLPTIHHSSESSTTTISATSPVCWCLRGTYRYRLLRHTRPFLGPHAEHGYRRVDHTGPTDLDLSLPTYSAPTDDSDDIRSGYLRKRKHPVRGRGWSSFTHPRSRSRPNPGTRPDGCRRIRHPTRPHRTSTKQIHPSLRHQRPPQRCGRVRYRRPHGLRRRSRHPAHQEVPACSPPLSTPQAAPSGRTRRITRHRAMSFVRVERLVMRKLVYGFGVSLDGYINDRDGGIDWTTTPTRNCTGSTTTVTVPSRSHCTAADCTS